MLNREISFYWFYLFWRFSSYQALDQRFFPLFPINYEICQTHIKLWLWPTLRDLLKNLSATLNWEIRDDGRLLVVLRVHALAFIWSIGDKPAGTSERELFIIALRCCLLSTSTFGNVFENDFCEKKSLWSDDGTLNPIRGNEVVYRSDLFLLRKKSLADNLLGQIDDACAKTDSLDAILFIRCGDHAPGRRNIIFHNLIFNHARKSINDWICAHLSDLTPKRKSLLSRNQIKLKHNDVDEGRPLTMAKILDEW